MDKTPYGAKVRLRYATLINYTANFLSLATSFLFVLIVTRKLSVGEFSVWTMIFSYMNYMLLFTFIYTYWVPREISRGFNVARAGLTLSCILGSAASVLYLGIIYMASQTFNQPLTPLTLSTLLLFENYVYRALNSMSVGHKPQYTGIGNLIVRFFQAILALIALVLLKMGLTGAVVTVIIARALGILLLLKVNWFLIKSSEFRWETIKLWLKRSWLPLYSALLPSIFALDTVIALTLGKTEAAIAYYGVAISISGVASKSTVSASPALYSRMLARGDKRDVEEVFWIIYAFSIPMVMGILAYTQPILAIFNPKYVAAALPVRIFVVSSLLMSWWSLMSVTLRGLEKADLIYTGSKPLVKSMLFKIPLTDYFAVTIYLSLVALAATMFSGNPYMIAIGWSIAFMSRHLIPLLVFTIWSIRLKLELPFRRYASYLLKFLFASTPIIPLSILVPVPIEKSIYSMVAPAALVFATFIGSYISILMAIDPKTRSLARAVIKEIFRKE